MLSLLVQDGELLLELSVVLARCVTTAHLLLHGLPQFQGVDRARLISVACAILIVTVLVVGGGLRLAL